MIRALLVGIAVAICVSAVQLAGLLDPLEWRTLDLRFDARGPTSPKTPIVLVTVDDDSLAAMGRPWPWPRSLHARLLDQIAKDNPLAIGVEFPLTEKTQDGEDRLLGAAIARASRVVLRETLRSVVSRAGVDPAQRRESVESPIPAVRAGAAGVGFVEWTPDADGVVRASALARHHAGEARLSFAQRIFDVTARPLGAENSRTAHDAEVRINYRGAHGTFPTYAYQQVYRGEIPPGTFTGRIVLVGLDAPGLAERLPTPVAGAGRLSGRERTGRPERAAGDVRAMSALEVQANLLDTLLADDGVRRVSTRTTVAVLWVFSVVGAVMARCLRPWLTAAGVGALGGGYLALAQFVFTRRSLWIEVTPALLAMLLGAGAMLVVGCVRRFAFGRGASHASAPPSRGGHTDASAPPDSPAGGAA
jgi:adenylate cyclase